ncbi:MAG: LamG domain-containing protein [Candidatus Competibacteraceae bacterium]|nr:LamG domain-containing protein [Candidatus Competibacteraceae bacterium]
MSLNSYVKLVQKFADASLVEDVSGDPFTSAGPVELFGEVTGAILTRDTSFGFANASLGITTEIFVGFWFYSMENRLGQNPSTSALIPLNVSLFDLGIILKVYEKTAGDGTNQIVMRFSNGNEVISTPYAVNEWHHFALTVIGGVGKTYVDGADATQSAAAVPSIAATTATLTVNQVSLPPTYATINNTGILSDLIICNDEAAVANIVRLINYGIDYAYDSFYAAIEEFDQPLLFDDPTSARVTGATKDGGGSYLMLTRSDGRLLRGSPKLWESRRDFSETNEAATVDFSGGEMQVADGGLTITSGYLSL